MAAQWTKFNSIRWKKEKLYFGRTQFISNVLQKETPCGYALNSSISVSDKSAPSLYTI